MTNTTTALQALIEECARDMAVKVAKNCDTVPNLTHPHIFLGLQDFAARAALSAPPAAQDAPSEYSDEWLIARSKLAVQGAHDVIDRHFAGAAGAARASQPATPAAATVPKSGWKEAAIAWNVCASIHETWAKGKDALYTTRQADFKRHFEEARTKALAATPAAHPVAGQGQAGWKPVPVEPTDAMLDVTTTCHKGRLYPQDNVHGPRAMRRREYVAMLAAAPTAPQAPALVPLTENQIMACLVEAKCIGKVWMSIESGVYSIDRPTANAMRLARAIEAARGITPTTKEQQA